MKNESFYILCTYFPLKAGASAYPNVQVVPLKLITNLIEIDVIEMWD